MKTVRLGPCRAGSESYVTSMPATRPPPPPPHPHPPPTRVRSTTAGAFEFDIMLPADYPASPPNVKLITTGKFVEEVGPTRWAVPLTCGACV